MVPFSFSTGGVYDEVHDLSQTELKVINIINNQIFNSRQVASIFEYKTLIRNIKTALGTLLGKNLIVYTIPDKLRSKWQQYKITLQGKSILDRHGK